MVVMRTGAPFVKRSVDPADALAADGIPGVRAWWNLSVAQLCEESLRRHEGLLSADGALVCTTGAHTAPVRIAET